MKISVEKLLKQVAKNQMSCSSLSKKYGIIRVALYRIMNGKAIPRIDTIGKLAAALNCEIEDITE